MPRRNKRRNARARQAAAKRFNEHVNAINHRQELSGLACFGKLDPGQLAKAQSTSRVVVVRKRRPLSTLS